MFDLNWLSRSALLVGNQGIEKSQSEHVLDVGLVGMGNHGVSNAEVIRECLPAINSALQLFVVQDFMF